MRHFFGHDASGALVHTVSGRGGVPADCDLTDPDSGHPLAVFDVENRGTNVVGMVLYVCPCDAGDPGCECASAPPREQYVLAGALTAKLVPTVKVDGVSVADGDVVVKTPSSVVSLTVEAALADGEEVAAWSDTAVYATAPARIPLAFTSGVSAGLDLTAPAQGIDGVVRVVGTKTTPFSFKLRGFA